MPESTSEPGSPSESSQESSGQITGPPASQADFTHPPVEPPEEVPTGVKFLLTAQSGPFPDPITIRAYKEIDEDLFRTIVRMADRRAIHVEEMQRTDLQRRIESDKGSRRERKLGQICGLIIALAGLTGATIVGILEQQWAASVIAGAPLVGLVSVFIAGRALRPQQTAPPPPEPRPETHSPKNLP